MFFKINKRFVETTTFSGYYFNKNVIYFTKLFLGVCQRESFKHLLFFKSEVANFLRNRKDKQTDRTIGSVCASYVTVRNDGIEAFLTNILNTKLYETSKL